MSSSRTVTGSLWVVDIIPSNADKIIPRGPDLDNFIRPFDPTSNKVIYQDPVIPHGFELVTDFPFRDYDQAVFEQLEQKPDIGIQMMNSFVKIEVKDFNPMENKFEYRVGSGCQITPFHVLTCVNLFLPH